MHSASPVALEVVPDPEEQLVKPAVEGTKNVFDSVVKSCKCVLASLHHHSAADMQSTAIHID